METACSQCGTRHLLNDAQIGSRPRVQFRCAKCGQANIVEVQRRPDQTLVMTPLPSFARGEGAGGPGNIIASEYQGLSLDRKSTRLNSSHGYISYAVFCLKKKTGKMRA